MSAKRQATTNLNHDNWDKEDEPEEKGTFKVADESELKNRVIKKATRRKVAGDNNSGANAAGVFSGFAGFGKAAGNTIAPSPFSFLSKIPAVTTTSTLSSTTKTVTSAETNADKSSNYYAKLKNLNQTVSEWIKTHVDKNPICLLTPIFKDYEKYLQEIENEEKQQPTASKSEETDKKSTTDSAGFGSFKFSAATSTSCSSSTVSSPPKISFGSVPTSSVTTSSGGIFGSVPKVTTGTETSKTNGFSFGLKSSTESASTTSTPSFSFGSSTAASAADGKKPFSFTPGGTPFTFMNSSVASNSASSEAKSSDITAAADDEDEEDQPPKVEFKQVVEDDAVYSKKCKVFVKKDGNFADKGVGTLYLKPVKDSDKTQLLVRADTNLGNILVNLILNEAIPAQRMGKNNVMMVCLPTPEDKKPTSMLLRVKTGEEADELLASIEKYKK